MIDISDPAFVIFLMGSAVGVGMIGIVVYFAIREILRPRESSPWWVEIQCQECGRTVREPVAILPGDRPGLLDDAALARVRREHVGELHIVGREWPASCHV